ncbi:hypothetical protein IKE67_08685 [bacterium]|nr:hypothetical protein [bacterium]
MARILFERQHNFFGDLYAVEQIIAEYSKTKKKMRHFHSVEIFEAECPNFPDSTTECEITKEQAKAFLKQAKQQERENEIKSNLYNGLVVKNLKIKVEV